MLRRATPCQCGNLQSIQFAAVKQALCALQSLSKEWPPEHRKVGSSAVRVLCQVVGASGIVFGLIGLYAGDVLLNFRSLTVPWLRLLWISASCIFFVVTTVLQVGSPASIALVPYEWIRLGLCATSPTFSMCLVRGAAGLGEALGHVRLQQTAHASIAWGSQCMQ